MACCIPNIRAMEGIIIDYFNKLFSSGEPLNIDAIIDLIPTKVMDNMSAILEGEYMKRKFMQH